MGQLVDHDRIRTPSFQLQPGDGTGASFADADVRHRRGYCAMRNCRQPIVSQASRLCAKHAAEIECLLQRSVRGLEELPGSGAAAIFPEPRRAEFLGRLETSIANVRSRLTEFRELTRQDSEPDDAR